MAPLKLQWLGGEHSFALPLGQLRALQQNVDAGPEQILDRMRRGTWRIDEIVEVIRLGLLGGPDALVEAEVGPMVTRLFQQHPIMEFKITAIAILAHALYGPLDDQPGKSKGEKAETPLENGSSPSSTETAPDSDLPPAK